MRFPYVKHLIRLSNRKQKLSLHVSSEIVMLHRGNYTYIITADALAGTTASFWHGIAWLWFHNQQSLSSNWFLRYLGLIKKCGNNILLHHSGPHHHATETAAIWMLFRIIVTSIFLTAKVSSGSSVVCIYIHLQMYWIYFERGYSVVASE